MGQKEPVWDGFYSIGMFWGRFFFWWSEGEEKEEEGGGEGGIGGVGDGGTFLVTILERQDLCSGQTIVLILPVSNRFHTGKD